MTQFQPSKADKKLPSPEKKQEIQDKKEKLQALKRDLKTAPIDKRAALKAEIKAKLKELKTISPNKSSW